MILVNDVTKVVIASSETITTKSECWFVEPDCYYCKEDVSLVDVVLPSEYEAGKCTYDNGVFTVIPEPEPEPEEPVESNDQP